MQWIKKFRNLFSPLVTTLIVAAIAIYTFTQHLGGSDLYSRLANILPALLVLIAVIGMQLAKQSLAAHLILLFTSYLASGRALIVAITSFDFQTLSFSATWSVPLIINAIIFIYLILYVLSFVFDKQAKFKLESGPVVTSAIIAFIFFFFRDGFSVAVLKIVPAIIALMFGSELFAIVLLLAGVIDVPFDLFGHIANGTLLNQTIGYFLFTAFAFYLIYGAIVGIVSRLQKK
ncbi:MAG: hypothetical protein WC992_06470 [Acholeplasmataceae bacterium]